ncbi:hypothetical protein BsWGS_11933 [Bradybaena similaris]
MAQRGRGPTNGMSSYSSSEMDRASRALSKAVAQGALRFLQTTFEIYPLEAVPNVWEGDSGMMEHVPPFPMPDFIALPVEPDAEACGLTSRVHHCGRSRSELEMPEEHDKISFKDQRQFLKKTGKDWKLLVSLARVYESLNVLSKCLIRVASRFTNHLVSIREKAAIQLAEVYGKMRKIKMCLHRAEVNFSKNGYSNLFQEMPLARKIAFKKQNHLQGELPESLRSIEEKFLVVRDKMGLIVRKNWEKLSPFKNVLNRVMKDVHTRCNLFRADVFQCLDDDDGDVGWTDKHFVTSDDAEGNILHSDEELDGGEKSEKIKTEYVGLTESSYVLSKEDRFWGNVTYIKKILQKTARTLKVLGKVNVRSASVRTKCKKGSAICRQMLAARRNMMTLGETLVQLKKEMQTENYEDKKLFTEEDLARLGVNGLTPDNSLAVAEAWLKILQNEHLKIRGERSAVLEKFGYDVEAGFENPCIDKNMKLMRICEHSKSIINAYSLDRVKKSSSQTDPDFHELSTDGLHNQGKTGDGGDQAISSLNAGIARQHAETDSDHHSKQPVVRETTASGNDVNAGLSTSEDVSFGRDTEDGESSPTGVSAADEHDASDEFSAEDISKTVNTVSFFLSSFGSAALSVNEESFKSASDDFIEKEKQYWDELQKLLRKINKTVRQLTAKSKQRYFGQEHVKSVMQPMHFKLKGLLKVYELHNVEGRRCGYCRYVTYESTEQLPEGYDYILVKSLDQIKDRIDTAYGHYIATAKKVGMPFSYKL